MEHHEIKANGVTIHVVEESESPKNPAVLLCHGFPAIWSSWKFQMIALAKAGYRVIAPDMRGYGRSSAPLDAELYTPFHTVGDMVAILNALNVETATVIGHDFGANVAWYGAMMRPDRFTAVCGISVPYTAPGGPSILDKMRRAGADKFYMFEQIKEESDKAWSNAAETIPGMFYWTSGEAPAETRWDPLDPSRGVLRPAPEPLRTIDQACVEDAIQEFTRTGFHGALNYYRAIDPFAKQWGAFAGAKISQPSMFLSGLLDGLASVRQPKREAISTHLLDLRSFVLLPEVGHWPQLEAPEATSEALLDFLRSL
jgi:pimeloyl-ACP methyl ester carboxylesterase